MPYAMCDEGWFCPTNNTVPQPAGNKCLAGHKCPQGSANQEPCPSGYYQPLEEQGECLECPAGMLYSWIFFLIWLELLHFYWEGLIFCIPQSLLWLLFHSALHLSLSKYAAIWLLPNCYWKLKNCMTVVGMYCDRQEASDEEQSGIGAPSHGVVTPKICPIGFYCPNGTQTARQYPCNDGTYSNQTGLEAFEQCLPCPEGYYCTMENDTAPTGLFFNLLPSDIWLLCYLWLC